MNGLPPDVVELTLVRESGEVLRWVGQEAAVVSRMVALVVQAAGGADLQVPDPQVSQPLRHVDEFVGRYRENHRKEGWLYRECPSVNMDVCALLPEAVTEYARSVNRDDEFGNLVQHEGRRYRLRVTVEAVPEE